MLTKINIVPSHFFDSQADTESTEPHQSELIPLFLKENYVYKHL